MIANRDSVAAFDLAVLGGGPAGSTAAAILLKYRPQSRVVILEKERFPREHIGESQLPAIMPILHEMGAWDKVEAADFPVKLGASLTWGRDNDEWDFDFYPRDQFKDEPRPAKYEGQRRFTAFQVERAIYDKILLEHAASMGAEVRMPCQVREIETGGDRVTGFRLESGEVITARYYLDCSGAIGILRRTLGIGNYCPNELRNIAVWDYWDDAKWAETIGNGGTRIQVRSLPYGWFWFIPIGRTRVSMGLVCPAEHYKKRGLTIEALYREAIASQPHISALVKDARPSGTIRTTKDWSHVSDRVVGENWFMCGEAAGFADPILSAGMTLAHSSGREAAYTIMELDRGEFDAKWLREQYDEKTRRNVRQHIDFAHFWYASNGCFTELQEHCQRIARESGLRMKPKEAWMWIAQGGFSNQSTQTAGFGTVGITTARNIVEKFTGGMADHSVGRFNVFKLNLVGTTRGHIAEYKDGRVQQVACYLRGPKRLPTGGVWGNMIRLLGMKSDAAEIMREIERAAPRGGADHDRFIHEHLQVLEAMVLDGWVRGELDPKRPVLKVEGTWDEKAAAAAGKKVMRG